MSCSWTTVNGIKINCRFDILTLMIKKIIAFWGVWSCATYFLLSKDFTLHSNTSQMTLFLKTENVNSMMAFTFLLAMSVMWRLFLPLFTQSSTGFIQSELLLTTKYLTIAFTSLQIRPVCYLRHGGSSLRFSHRSTRPT